MSEAKRHRVLSRLLADSARGELRDLSYYAVIFPDDPDLLTEEYRSISEGPQLFDAPVLRHYELLRELGRGGQAIVYLAHDQRLDREVALKVLTGSAVNAERRLARFQREAQVASRLEHPHICPIFETGMEGSTAFMALRYLKGGSLKQLMDRVHHDAGSESGRPLLLSVAQREQLLALIEKVARAVHAAHEAGIIHRDLKPANIMLSEAAEPFVVDFGLALWAADEESALTETGDFFGTPAYMPPERLRSEPGLCDRRVDVWALGVILFEMMAGRRPFGGPTQAEIQRRICGEEPPRLRHLDRRCSRDLEVIVETALAKDLSSRYATALDLAEDLRRHRELQPIRARRRGTLLRLHRWGQRNPLVALFLPALLVILSMALIMTDDALKQSREQAAEMARLTEHRHLAQQLDLASALIMRGSREAAEPILAALDGAGFEPRWVEVLRGDLQLRESDPGDQVLATYLAAMALDPDHEAGLRIESLIRASLKAKRPRYWLHRSLYDAYAANGQLSHAMSHRRTIEQLWPELVGFMD